MSRARQLIETLLAESTDYYYTPDAKRATYDEIARATLKTDGVQLLRYRDERTSPLGPTFDPKAEYVITDGDNYLHLDFDEHGAVTGASRYGANDVEELVSFLGDMVDEHEAQDAGLFDDDDDVQECFRAVRSDPLYEKLDSDDKEEIDKRIAKALKSKEGKDAVRDIAKDVLNDFVKTLYVKRGFWSNDLK